MFFKQIMIEKCRCKLCNKAAGKKHKSTTPWYCKACMDQLIPFSSLTDLDFDLTISGKKLNNLHNSNLIECPQHIKTLFKELNNVNSATNCKYFDISEINQFKNKEHLRSYIHLNIGSLSYHIDELRNLITAIDLDIEVIGITESNLKQNDTNITNVEIQGYSVEHSPTEANKGGALMYINKALNYKTRKDLEIYKPKKLESTFIEVLKPRERNVIVGCIYRHPSMTIKEFNNDFLENLLDKINCENKDVVLLGDFNINLLQYDDSPDVAHFLKSMCSSSLFPSITQPTRVTSKSRTLIDNIFINFHSPEIISGNIAVSISDHLAQIITIPSKKSLKKPRKMFKRCFKNFNNEKFIQDIIDVEWNKHIADLNVNDATSVFLKLFESILDAHAPYKQMTKNQIKLKQKPWITSGILRSIKIKDLTHKKYLRAKNGIKKDALFVKFKTYRNVVSNLLRISKKNYYTAYFCDNMNNVKNTWKGIKEIINIKSTKNYQPTSLKIGNEHVTDSTIIANSFNEYFSSVGVKLSEKIIPSKNSYESYLNEPNDNSFFIQAATKDEVNNYIGAIHKVRTLKIGKIQIPPLPLYAPVRFWHNPLPPPVRTYANTETKSYKIYFKIRDQIYE